MILLRTALAALLTSGCAGAARSDPRPPTAGAPSIFGAPVAAPPAAPTPPAGVQIDADGRARDADAPAAPPAAGRPVSLDLVDADIRHVLRLIGDVSGLEFAVGDGVTAQVTVRLVDVPWDHALQAILSAEGLAMRALPGGRGIEVYDPR